MALINKDNESKWFSDDLYLHLKKAVEYFDDPLRSPIAKVIYVTKDSLNKSKLYTKMIQKEYDPEKEYVLLEIH